MSKFYVQRNDTIGSRHEWYDIGVFHSGAHAQDCYRDALDRTTTDAEGNRRFEWRIVEVVSDSRP